MPIDASRVRPSQLPDRRRLTPGRTGRQRFPGKRKGESYAVDNSGNTADSMGAWLGVRLYDEWVHSHLIVIAVVVVLVRIISGRRVL